MSFIFSLASVLRVRVLREEREERLLQAIFREIEHTQQLISNLDGEMVKLKAERMASMSSKTAGRDIHLTASILKKLCDYRKALELEQERLQQLKEVQMKLYQAAYQERQVIDDLREKQMRSHLVARAALDQRTMDDSFNARRHRLR